MVDVTRADRKAATSYLSPAKERTVEGLIQAFARHRIAERERNAGIAEAWAEQRKLEAGHTLEGTSLYAEIMARISILQRIAQAIRASSDD